MQCHKCPHIESIQRGDYTSKPWKETPCAKCKLGEDNYSIPFDEENPDRTAGLSCASSDSLRVQPALSDFSERTADGPPAPCGADISVCASLPPDALLPASTFASCVQGLLILDPVLRDIVAMRYQGLPYREIAERQGISTQLAEMRHKRALRDWPALQSLFPEKVAKQSRRKSRR